MPDPVLRTACPIFRTSRIALAEETFATCDGPVTKPVIHHPGAVVILAEPEPGCVLLVRQFRYAVRAWTLEVPAGTREPGEAPEATARRELAEEAGFTARRMSELLRFLPAPGVSDEEMILYRAEELSPAVAAPDHGELVSRVVMRRDELPGAIASGLIRDAKTLLALAILGVPIGPR